MNIVKNTKVKSVGAVLGGLAVAAIASSAVDSVLQATGALPTGHIYASVPMVLTVVTYRTVFNVLGAYVAARLAPARPLAHALGLGIFGSIGSLVTAIATWNMEIGPHYYPLTLAALGVPAAYAGATLAARHRVRATAPVVAPALA
ncbi:hypothetical protein [Nocardia crassostreae]|uniref:hypothetical protein n=1 Tax=Nocardia crassostreae TaxID=53428 RepID=UPI000835A392|nr:hypothetical protein [Nocardia crassostreae]